MADYEYSGDQATFSQDRVPEMLMHFSDQFTKRAEERDQKKAAMQKAELERQIRNQAYIGSALKAKDYEDQIQGKFNNSFKLVKDLSRSGASEIDVMAAADQEAANLHFANGKYKDTNANIVKDVAEKLKLHPGLDGAALITNAKIAAYKKKDPKTGEWIDKTDTEIDGTHSYVNDVYNSPMQADLFPENVSQDELEKQIKEEGMQPLDVPPTYNADQSIKSVSVKGNIASSLVNYKIKDGKAVIEPHSQNYKLPGVSTDYVDDHGQVVKVISDDLYEKFYKNNDAVRAIVNKKVNQTLKTAAEAKGAVISSLNPEGEYADMLRKKTLYDVLNANVQNKYILNVGTEDKSFERKGKLADDRRADQQLALSREDNFLAREKFKWDKLKENKKQPTVNDITPLTVSYAAIKANDLSFQDGKGKGGVVTKKFIRESDIDGKDLALIAGLTFDEYGNIKSAITKPFVANINGVPVNGYLVEPNGDWTGLDGKVIKKERVADDQLKYFTKDDLPASSKGVRGLLQQAKDFVSPKVAPKAAATTPSKTTKKLWE